MPDRPRLTRDPDAPRPGVGIVHLGLGAFFRAHAATYIAAAMAAEGGDWGVTGVSLMRPDQRDRLAPQGGVYSLVVLGPEGREVQTIDVVRDVLVAPEDPEAVLAAMADPKVHIVSLTVTEKGYCHNPATGRLNLSHPGIIADLAAPDTPATVPGFLTRALARRRAAGVAPFTVLCCDNLPDNGPMVRGVVLDFARAADPALADWIAAHVAFPATMVDRITPATSDADIEDLAERQGVLDRAPVLTEPFSQWVIEDDFRGPRPAFEAGGAQIVRDVTPFELMKLRCLNGTHSALAYLGYLAGHETVAEAVADPALAGYIRYLWAAEIVPSVPQPEGEDLDAYTAALFDRYANPGIRHRTWQIAMDGSQKLPQRLLGTVADNLDADRPVSGLALAVAAWMRYVGGVDEAGQPIEVKDPLAERLRALSDGADDPDGKVRALLAVDEIFPAALAGSARFADAVTAAYRGLVEKGARAMAAQVTV